MLPNINFILDTIGYILMDENKSSCCMFLNILIKCNLSYIVLKYNGKTLIGVINLKKNNNKDTLKNLTLISQIGISIITPILLGVFIGQLLDKWVNTKGVFMIIFIILGVGGGFMNLFKITGLWKNKRK